MVNVFKHALLVTQLAQILKEYLNVLAAMLNLVLSVVTMTTVAFVKQELLEKKENVDNALMVGSLNKEMMNALDVEEVVKIVIELTVLSATNIISS